MLRRAIYVQFWEVSFLWQKHHSFNSLQCRQDSYLHKTAEYYETNTARNECTTHLVHRNGFLFGVGPQVPNNNHVVSSRAVQCIRFQWELQGSDNTEMAV